jgi:glucose/arabinose dehydrogenase
VGETNEVVRFAYKTGDLKASGKAEVIVPNLPVGGGHWTVALSPDGSTMYVSVGSGSNVAEDLPPKPDLVAWQKEHWLGAAWGAREEWRADVLAFSPDGRNRRAYATGIRNLLGAGSAAGHWHTLLRHQRARRTRRQPAARLCDQRHRGRVLRLALVLHRRE